VKIEEREAADLLAAVAAEEFNQAMGSGDKGPHRVRAAAAVIGEMASPARGQCPRRMSFPL
jgi:hypothetical protein